MTESSVAAVEPKEAAAEAAAGGSAADEPTRVNGRKKVGKGAEQIMPRALEIASGDRLDLLSNVEMDVTAELGRTRMTVRELLSLTPGTVVELDRVAGSPIDLFVNGTLIARGEVVVIDEEFGIRISEIVGPNAAESPR